MNNNFQVLVTQILENNSAGMGGVFGTPQTPVYNAPSDINSADTVASGDARAVMGGVYPLEDKKGKKSKKGKKTKSKKPLVIRRNLPSSTL